MEYKGGRLKGKRHLPSIETREGKHHKEFNSTSLVLHFCCHLPIVNARRGDYGWEQAAVSAGPELRTPTSRIRRRTE